jgi:hypothetical protein
MQALFNDLLNVKSMIKFFFSVIDLFVPHLSVVTQILKNWVIACLDSSPLNEVYYHQQSLSGL